MIDVIIFPGERVDEVGRASGPVSKVRVEVCRSLETLVCELVEVNACAPVHEVCGRGNIVKLVERSGESVEAGKYASQFGGRVAVGVDVKIWRLKVVEFRHREFAPFDVELEVRRLQR